GRTMTQPPPAAPPDSAHPTYHHERCPCISRRPRPRLPTPSVVQSPSSPTAMSSLSPPPSHPVHPAPAESGEEIPGRLAQEMSDPSMPQCRVRPCVPLRRDTDAPFRSTESLPQLGY